MLPLSTVHAITDSLRAAETTAHRAGWSRPPALLAIGEQPATGGGPPRIVAVPMRVDGEKWHRHPGGPTAVLAEIATFLRDPVAQTIISLAAEHDPRTRLLGWAVIYDDRVDAEHGGQVRRVDAVDLDRRLYRLTRTRDSDQVVAVLDDDPATEGGPPTRVPLTDMLDASRRPHPAARPR